MGSLWKILKNYRSQLILVLTPLLLLPLVLKKDLTVAVKCKPDCGDECKQINGTDALFTPPADYTGTLKHGDLYKEEIKKPYKCLFCLGVMATYWTFEATPLAVTSLMPMFLFPLFGILKASVVSAHYFKDINFLFFGGLVVAIAIEKCNLHLRIALSVMKIAGAKLHTMMGAFMLVTAFLSMWISNTATTAMMLPIAVATVKTITGEDGDEENSQNSDPEADQGFDNKELHVSPISSGGHLVDGFDGLQSSQSINLQIPNDSFATVAADQSYQQLVPRKIARKKRSTENGKLLMKAMLLAVAYSANIGGIGTLIGTPVNLILVEQLKSVYPTSKLHDSSEYAGSELNRADEGVTFLSWMMFAVPVSIISNVLCWMWLLTVYVGPKKVWRDIRQREMTPEDKKVTRDIQDRYNALGKMSYTEIVVLIHFVSLAVLWFTRNGLPGVFQGWKKGFEEGHVKDSTAALLVCFSLFVFPSKPNFFKWVLRKKGDENENRSDDVPKPASTILQWKEVQQKLAWDVIILLGAGFALATACTDSGLSKILGDKIGTLMDSLSEPVIPFVISVMISFITGFTSNTSTASVFLPILMAVCVNMNMNPLKLCIPVTMSCSFAFILPIATPPNAIAFSYGALETVDMIKVGTLLNFLCTAVTAALLPMIATPIYHLNTYPEWAKTEDWFAAWGQDVNTTVPGIDAFAHA